MNYDLQSELNIDSQAKFVVKKSIYKYIYGVSGHLIAPIQSAALTRLSIYSLGVDRTCVSITGVLGRDSRRK